MSTGWGGRGSSNKNKVMKATDVDDEIGMRKGWRGGKGHGGGRKEHG